MDIPPSYEEASGQAPDPRPSEVINEGDCIWIRDDFPLWGPASNELTEEDKQLVTWAVSRRSIVTDGVTYFVYCRNTASWAQMESVDAACELLATTDTKAYVNYGTALMKFYPLLKRLSNPISHLERSVCIGTWRLTFSVSWQNFGPIVVYKPHPEVIENIRGPEHTRMYMFVRSPIVMPYPFACPHTFMIDMEETVINAILKPLRDDQKIDFLWRMGKMLVDGDNSQPVVIVFYGKDGHEGKGTLALNISRMFPGMAMWMTDDLIGSKSKWPKEDVVMNLCEKRLLVCDETEIGDGFSYNNIKRWTSNSPVSNGTMTAFLSQNIIAMSNTMPFYEKAAINRSIGRRLVIYDMRKYMGRETPIPRSAFTNKVMLKFVSLCLAVTEAYKHPPTSLKTALYTFFRKNVNKITAGLIYDPASTHEESLSATIVMAIRCNVPSEQLCTAFESMSPGLVGRTPAGSPFIKCFKPITRTLTEHGREVVLERKGQVTIDLETLKEQIRLI